MIEIKEIKTKKDLKLFATFPLKLYKGCPYYVPSLRSDELSTFNPKKNLSLGYSDAKGFLCYKDGELCGRIMGIISHYDNEKTGKKYVRFSRFECIDDEEVFKALLGAVEKYGLDNGMEIIHGPWGFNDTDREGMLTFGFDKRATYATNYYYPYFHERMPSLGFKDESKWQERKFTVPDTMPDIYGKLAEKVKERINVKDVTLSMPMKKLIKLYGKKMFVTVNESYGQLDGYVPVNDDTIDNVLNQFATIINKDYFSMLIDEDDEVAAFAVVLPSICEALKTHKGKLLPTGFIGILRSIAKPKGLEMALIGVKDKYKNTGIASIMIDKILKNMIKNGVKDIESNPMLESNVKIQALWKHSENEVIKKRQTYIKPIGSLIQ